MLQRKLSNPITVIHIDKRYLIVTFHYVSRQNITNIINCNYSYSFSTFDAHIHLMKKEV